MSEKILVIEDEPALQETIAYNLKNQGYRVDTSGDGRDGLAIARRTKPDLIVLDIMLPGIDGFEVTRLLRKDMNVPILILTAREEEIDRVVGLEVGADDYLTKPFSMREFLARVKALLRRVRLDTQVQKELQETAQIIFGNLTIDPQSHEIRIDGKPISMKPKEYDLLAYFATHHRQVVSREKLLEEVWGWDYIGSTRTVDVHVRWLRSKIEPNPQNPQRLVTVRGVGYRFEG